MISIQGYFKGKRMFYRSSLYWEDAFELLEMKRHLQIDKIDVQVFTEASENIQMPVNDIEDLKSIDEAQKWINHVMGKLIKNNK